MSRRVLYYGVTKRGWMKRFKEHLKAALNGKNQRVFPKLLGEAIQNRFNRLLRQSSKSETSGKMLTGTYHVVCAAGRTKQNAFDIERYLIDKRSISVLEGLNMVNGKQVN